MDAVFSSENDKLSLENKYEHICSKDDLEDKHEHICNKDDLDDESLELDLIKEEKDSPFDFDTTIEDFYIDEGPPIEDEKPEADGSQEIETSVNKEDHVFNEIKEIILKRKSSSRSESSIADSDISPQVKTSSQFTSLPFGLIPKASYEHGNMCSDIMGVTYNERMRQFIILDAKGMTTWKRDAVERRVNRALQYPKYEYRLITHLVYAKKHNCFFGLGKDFSLKVFNRDFVETCSVSADLRSVIFMIFNPVRDELLTGGVGGTKVWQFHQMAGKNFGSLRPLANYALTLKHELPNVGGGWVKRAELDCHLEQLYCCSDTGLYVYNLDGKELLKYERAHGMTITGCRYSQHANVLVTSSVDTEVKVWSLVGGLVHTFRGHSRAVTNLMLHPLTSSIIITCSLDGSVRMWSLDTMECFYSLVVSVDGVLWMGQTDDHLLYLCTVRALTLWNVNYSTQFWALSRSSIIKMSLCGSKSKTKRLMVVSDDSSVRLMAQSNGKNLSTVLPPPCISPLEKVRSVSYSRDENTMYLLVNSHEIWIYTTRTDPACRIAIWKVFKIQLKAVKKKKGNESRGQLAPVRFTFNKQPIAHRATESGNGMQPAANCCCLLVLNSAAKFWNAQGSQVTDQDAFLLLGLEDGRILFMDLKVKGQKYLELKTGKDPVLEMTHDVTHNCLTTLYRVKGMNLVHMWSLPDLELMHEVYTAPDLTAYTRLDNFLLTGHTSGCVIFHQLEKAVDVGLHKAKMLPPVEDILEAQHKPEHSAPVIALDVCVALRIFVSCSKDGAIKIWDHEPSILTEIMLDPSLSAACFLNNQGDMVVGFHKHLFHIDHTKVCPLLNIPESDVDSFDKESIIYEDPAVMFEGILPYPDPVNLDSYLVPFDVEFSKDFLEGKIKPEPKPSETDLSERESRASMAPTEIYLSPISTPRRRLSQIDMMVSGEVSNQDLLSYMEMTMQHLAEKEKRDRRQMIFEHKRESESKTSALRRKLQLRQKKAGKSDQVEAGVALKTTHRSEDFKFSFPKFGKSPGPTPEPSAPPTPDIQNIELEELQDRDKDFDKTVSKENDSTPVKKKMDDEIRTFLQYDLDAKVAQVFKTELPAPRKKFGLAGITIDAESLMKASRPDSVAKTQTKPQQTAAIIPGSSAGALPSKKVEHEPAAAEKKPKKEKIVRKKFVDRRSQVKQRQAKNKVENAEAPPTQIQALEIRELELEMAENMTLNKSQDKLEEEGLVPEQSEEGLVPEQSEEDDDQFPKTTEHATIFGHPGEYTELVTKFKVPDLPPIPPELPSSPMKPSTPTSAIPKMSAAEAKAALLSKLNRRTAMDFAVVTKLQKGQEVTPADAGQLMQTQDDEVTLLNSQENDKNLGLLEKRNNAEVKNSSDLPDSEKKTQKQEVSSVDSQVEPILPEDKDKYDAISDKGSLQKQTMFRALVSPESSHHLGDDMHKNGVSYDGRPEPNFDLFSEEDFNPRFLSSPGFSSVFERSERSELQVDSLTDDPTLGQQLDTQDQHSTGPVLNSSGQENTDPRLKSAQELQARSVLPESEMYDSWARPQTSFDKRRERAELFYEAIAEMPEFQSGILSANLQTEGLQAAFEQAMRKYQFLARAGLVSSKLYKNNDQFFAENWHERQIERHMLLRMQRELRFMNVHKKRQLLEQMKIERTKQHLFMDHWIDKRIYLSHTAPPMHHRDTREDNRPAITIPAPSPAQLSRPHTATGVTHMTSRPPPPNTDIPPPTIRQQLQEVLQHRAQQQEMLLNQREKTELGHRKPFRYRLSDFKERKKRVDSSELPLDFDPWQIDPRNPNALRPKSSKSIPSKCKYYALITKPKIKLTAPIPTPLEEQLLAERFPEQGEKVFKLYEGLLSKSPRRPNAGISYSPYKHQLYG